VNTIYGSDVSVLVLALNGEDLVLKPVLLLTVLNVSSLHAMIRCSEFLSLL